MDDARPASSGIKRSIQVKILHQVVLVSYIIILAIIGFIALAISELTSLHKKPFVDNCSLTNASLPGGHILEVN